MDETELIPKKKNDKLLWIILSGFFLLTTIVLGFLYVTKKDKMTVVFVDRNDNIVIEKVNKGDKVSKKEVNDHDFLGWYYNSMEFDFNTKIDHDYILIAHYDDRKVFTVTFDTNGGNKINPVKVKENDKVIEPEMPIKSGYLFTEWTLNGKTYDFNTPVTKDITLKALWRVHDNSIIVRFDTNGGSTIKSQKVKIGGVAKKPINPTKYGYNFKEWQLNGKTYNFNSVVNSNITLKAVWIEKSKVTLSFNSDGGSSVSSKKVYVNEKVGTLPTPTRSDYVFIRWDLNGKTFNSNSMISKNTEVKAIWKMVDDYNYDNALSAIKANYKVTKDGEVINVTSKGCTITHDNITTSTNTITFHITCGNKSGTKTSKASIQTSDGNPRTKTINYNTRCLGYITIPKIKDVVNSICVRWPDKSKYSGAETNNVNTGIYTLPSSNYPSIKNGNLILAAHSGTASISYFKTLYKLSIGDSASIKFNGNTYTYVIKNIYYVEKTGTVRISRNPSKTTLTLITCTKDDETKQTVYILELHDIDGVSYQ